MRSPTPNYDALPVTPFLFDNKGVRLLRARNQVEDLIEKVHRYVTDMDGAPDNTWSDRQYCEMQEALYELIERLEESL